MTDLFTENEIAAAKTIIKCSLDSVQVHRRIHDEIITEKVMDRIDTATGQHNSRDYMAYRLEYIAQ